MCMYHHHHDYFRVQTLRIHYTVTFVHVLHKNTFTMSLSMCTLNRFILENDVKIAKFINNIILTEYVVERKITCISQWHDKLMCLRLFDSSCSPLLFKSLEKKLKFHSFLSTSLFQLCACLDASGAFVYVCPLAWPLNYIINYAVWVATVVILTVKDIIAWLFCDCAH